MTNRAEAKMDIGINIYLAVYGFILLMYVMSYKPIPLGEWDDYSLVTVSIINEHNVGISASDVEKAKELFPTWSTAIDSFGTSPYTTKSGEQMTWYFCTYSLVCVPFMLLLSILKIPLEYTFALTNYVALMLGLIVCKRRSNLLIDKKILLILLLSFNPIVFYLPWISSEVFMYVMVMISMLYWMEKRYKRGALFISIAGTMNPTILVMGMIMIVDFFHDLLIVNNIKNVRDAVQCYLRHWKEIIIYGCCYIIALIPFGYNFYNTGYINLTASLFKSTSVETPTWKRFIVYLFDWNFGFLPYYNIIFLLMFFLLIIALIKKQWNYGITIIGFFGVVYAYSFMVHINCGMSGISRYNAWSGTIIIFAILYNLDELLTRRRGRTAVKCGGIITAVLSVGILLYYGPMAASNTMYTSMMPIASFVLDKCPYLYQPLYSTFNSRVNHTDGGYNWEAQVPIIYENENGVVKKILVTPETVEKVKDIIDGDSTERDHFEELLANVTDAKYISLGNKYRLKSYEPYYVGDTIWFSGEDWNGDKFVKKGLSKNENQFTWSDGKEAVFSFGIKDYEVNRGYIMHINLWGIYGETQAVKIEENGVNIFNAQVTQGGTLSFEIHPDHTGKVNFTILLPNSISLPISEGGDGRRIALAFESAIVEVGK